MTSSHTWNPTEIVMVQAIAQVGSMLWKRRSSVEALHHCDIWMQIPMKPYWILLIHPLRVGEQISEHC